MTHINVIVKTRAVCEEAGATSPKGRWKRPEAAPYMPHAALDPSRGMISDLCFVLLRSWTGCWSWQTAWSGPWAKPRASCRGAQGKDMRAFEAALPTQNPGFFYLRQIY